MYITLSVVRTTLSVLRTTLSVVHYSAVGYTHCSVGYMYIILGFHSREKAEIKMETFRNRKSRIWEMKEDKYTKMRDIRKNVLPKFMKLCMETPCLCPFQVMLGYVHYPVMYITDRVVRTTDRVMYTTGRVVRSTDRAMYITDRVVRTTDSVTTDRVVRATDRGYVCNQQSSAYSRQSTDRFVLTTDRVNVYNRQNEGL